MMRLPARVLALLFAVFPAAALALGMGNVEVMTTLNEPLRAEIPITGIRPGEVDQIEIRLGTDEQFRRAGIERPFHLTRLKFKVVPDGERKARVEVTTRESVTEPFLNFLVELDWPSGRMIREYTLLLDPPVYGAAIASTRKQSIARVESVPEPAGGTPPQPIPTPESMASPEPPPPPVTPARAPATSSAPSFVAPESEPMRAPEPSLEPAPALAPAPPPTPAPEVTTALSPDLAGIDRYGPVVANESLWSIAKRVRPDQGVSIQRMMFAILEANRDAFFLDNINALKKGAVLRIPGRDEIGPDDKALAMAEVRRHVAIWNDYRSQLAGAPTLTPEGAQAAAPSTTQSQTTSPAVSAGEDAARLQLLAAGASPSAGAPGDQANLAQLQQELNMALEEADSKQLENRELSERLSETERIINDLNRMLELKDDEIASLQNQLRQQEGAPVPAPEPAATAEPEPAPAAAPEPLQTAAAEPEPVPAAAEPEPTPAVAAEPEPAPAAAAEPEPAPTAAADPEPVPPPKPKPVLRPPPEPQQVSFLGELVNTVRGYVPSGVDPILLAGGLGIVLILGGGLALYRRRQAAEVGVEPEAIDFEDEVGALAASDDDLFRDDTQPEDEDKTLLASDEETEPAGSDAATVESADEDPLSELNIYMAYEHFDQAEDLVRRAIADSPDRHDYRLKLLEVFYAAKNLPAFQQAAQELRDSAGADSPLMSTALGWWEDLAPGQDLFGGVAQSPTSDTQSSATGIDGSEDEVFDVTSGMAGDGDESAVDFDLGGFETTGAGEADEDSQGSSVDFDLDSGESEEVAPAAAESSSDVEFDLSDLGGDTEDEAKAASSGDLEFETQKDDGAAAVDVESDGLDFDVSEGDGEAANAIGLDDSAFDMNLNLEAATEDSSEPESAKQDQGLDFEFDGTHDDTQDDVGGGMELELESFDESDTNSEADGDLTAVDERFDQDAIEPAPPSAALAPGEDDLSLDFDIGADVDDGKSESDDVDLAIGMDSDDSDADDDLDFAIEGGTDEELSGVSAGEGGSSSDVDFEIGGDSDSDQKIGIDTVFDGVFDETRGAEASAADGGSDDDPLGIGGGSSELPALDTDTEDAVDLTFLGEAGGNGTDDLLADLEFGDENTDDSNKTEFMLRDVPKPHAGDTDVAADAIPGNGSDELDDIQTKLDLAEAYIEMGDSDGARGILGEVMSEGSETQQGQAKDLLQKLG